MGKSANNAVLIAGGYGTVGQQIARIIRQRRPDLPLIIGGRNPAQAEPLARELAHTTAVALDVGRASPLNGIRPRAVLAVVNDPSDYLLMDAVREGIPYADIARWTERLKMASARVAADALRAPVMLASSWMAGVAATVAVAISRQLRAVDRIDISVLYSLKDKAGPNSAEYMDRLATPLLPQARQTQTG